MARSKTQATPAPDFIPCRVAQLPEEDRYAAARSAASINPANRPPPLGMLLDAVAGLAGAPTEPIDHREFIAVMTTKYWHTDGVRLGVSFLEQTPAALRDKILAYANKWGKWANVQFSWSQSGGEVRLTRSGDGYWSYLGTDVLHIPAGQPTICLQGFSLSTPESEYDCVVCHEFGHTIGCPHEHLRQEIIARLDPQKTVRYFQQMQGWSAQTTVQQVLTPVSESSIRGTPHAEEDSIMCYQLPAAITKDGRPIVGGSAITEDDGNFIGGVYPRAVQPPPPPPGTAPAVMVLLDSAGKELSRFNLTAG
jgi:hypothetical protein